MVIKKKFVRFDWAIKKLLCQKANFDILEGFLTELLGYELKIIKILESESNKDDFEDKYNRVDILAELQTEELIIVEIQNEPEVDYFHRMLYGVSKVITDYISEGQSYSNVKKVIAINIAYFNLGQGNDYIYEYNGNFIGKHNGDILQPSIKQKNTFGIEHIKDIFPKYYLLKVNNFDDVAKDTLDEWIYFLKNSEIPASFKAKGLEKARKKMQYEKMSENEKSSYRKFMENRRIESSVLATAVGDSYDKGFDKGVEIGLEKVVEESLKNNLDMPIICKITGLNEIEILKIKAKLNL